MRHVPTALYIDTQFFKTQGLRFDTKSFISLKATFAKGGLRLLVPAIMERELFRHFHKLAEKTAADFIRAQNAYPVNRLSFIEPPDQEDLKQKCTDEMHKSWKEFTDHFVLESLPIVGNLEEVVDWYFAITPPFGDKNSKQKEFPDAFIISTLDQYNKQHHANIAVISDDNDFNQACASRRYIWHFPTLEKYIEAFAPELSYIGRLQDEIDLTKPITTEDLTELKAILARGNAVTALEIRRVMQLLESRGANYDYFFLKADDLIWFQYLSENGYFANPPTSELPHSNLLWAPLEYLIRIFDSAPEKVLDEVSKLPDSKNARILEGVFKIALKANSVDALLKLSRFIYSFLDYCTWNYELIISLLEKPFIFDRKLSELTPSLLLKLVEFHKDHREAEKLVIRRDDSGDFGSPLEPKPRFGQWEYQQILDNGVRLLVRKEPYQVARILIDAAASMIRLGIHHDELEKRQDEDYSEIWCRRLDKPDRDYQESRETLIYTLTYACEQVYQQAPETVDALDLALRNQRWKIFTRLRQHLYAFNPSPTTLPWIREFILSYDDYSKSEYHYEFQLMLRTAVEYFGSTLLTENELTTIINEILSGPSREDYREWMGELYSDESFKKRQRYFHRMQLRPFTSLLNGQLRHYLDEDNEQDEITDDQYSPIGKSSGGVVSYLSPKPVEELEDYTDAELLAYLNDWNDEHRDKTDWLTEVNISALSGVFQSLFKDRIASDSTRIAFWMTHRENIIRPIYVAAMVKAMQALVEAKEFSNLECWIEFCAWVLTHPDTSGVVIEGQPKPSEESSEYPDWSSSRRAVVDFIGICVNEDTDVPIVVRQDLSRMLQQVCCQFDSRLDGGYRVLLNRDEPLTEAINNTRSKALEALIHFGFWVRRQIPDEPLPDVINILSNRISSDAEYPLTRPEYAMLGMHFRNMCMLLDVWAAEQRDVFFPKGQPTLWRDAFSSYIRFNQPRKGMFDVLREEYEYSLVNFAVFGGEKSEDKELIHRLGQHLFSFYLWEVYPLIDETSLLERFYGSTADDRQYWARIFSYIGRSFSNSGKNLDSYLTERAKAFFDWRLQTAEKVELQEFSSWLTAECFEPEWRLHSYLKTLEFGFEKNIGLYAGMKALNALLIDNLGLVVECFKKITDQLNSNTQMYLSARDAKPILKAGLNANDQSIRQNAEQAKDKLLQLGRFEFLDLD